MKRYLKLVRAVIGIAITCAIITVVSILHWTKLLDLYFLTRNSAQSFFKKTF